MSYYPDFVDQNDAEYNSEVTPESPIDSTSSGQNSGTSCVERISDNGDLNDLNVADVDRLCVFDDGHRVRTSATSISGTDNSLDDTPYVSQGCNGYECQIQDWESYRGVETTILRSTSTRLRSVEGAFEDDAVERDNRPSCLLIFTFCLLFLELGGAMIAVIFFEPLVECCGDSFISESETTTNAWNMALYGISIGYLTWVIVDFPVVAISKEPVFLFNPMIGFLLCMHMLYVTGTTYAYTIFGLETIAMLGQSYVLTQLSRHTEICIHSLFNFVMCGITVYALIELTRQGGYCIVGGTLQGVFTDSTCDTQCIDESSCNICVGNATQCFISFAAPY